MITAQQLLLYRFSSDGYIETETLKAKFSKVRHERSPLYITKSEFDEILRWKLRGQYERQTKNHQQNTEELIRTVTGTALTITHPESDYELELRFGILCTLRGVGIPVASAVLALVFPDKYAVVDFRVWRQIFDKEGTAVSISEYKRYLKQINQLAAELEWLPQEVDLAIWEYDRVNG